MQTKFEPQAIESTIYQNWERSGCFQPQAESGLPYCIMLPPPNVTGTLHMGHGFQVTLMDILIRYHRMKGDRVLWQVGTDHAGIATQMVVERELAKKNIKRTELGREKFLEEVWRWQGQSDGTIKKQLRQMGASVDWTRERFSLDEQISKAVLEVFVKLYREGIIYRGLRLVNWDPQLQTAISDLEIINEETQGELFYLRYPISGVNENEYIVVATTRPETMLGDVAVAVNPNDERYQKLIGKKLKLPLTEREIPIIADDYVDSEFGTGAVKITPAHDFNDYKIGQRHQLELINIFNPDATLNDEAPEKFRGLDRFVARKQIIQALKQADLIEKITPHKLTVPRGDRTNSVVEPYLTPQWYIQAKPLAEKAIAAVKNSETQFVPENWEKTYFQWLENIEDWCISRQLWWGHRIPAWYDETGKVYVGYDENDVRKAYQLDANVILKQDDDVLDTWFSAALWPFATLGWPENTADFKTFYPTSILVTGFDIIFFWVARMMMMGIHFTGKVPFEKVYVHGLIRDKNGQKMSKSKGNTLDPIDLIQGVDLKSLIEKRTFGLMQPQMAEKIKKDTEREFPNGIPAFGTDALRFAYASLATHGRDIRFSLDRIEGYRNFCNKIWNAARFILMQVENKPLEKFDDRNLHPVNQFILTRLQQVIVESEKHLQDLRFDLLANCLYQFVWYEFCDWYLELTKSIFLAENQSVRMETRYCLVYCFEVVLRLLHPLMPFITEEIWQRFKILLGISTDTIMLSPYPEENPAHIFTENTAKIQQLIAIITAIRTIRSEMSISPAQTISIWYFAENSQLANLFDNYQVFIQNLTKATEIKRLEKMENKGSAIAVVPHGVIFVPLKGLVDLQEEAKRLTRNIEKLEQMRSKSAIKLNNEDYIRNAPQEIVAQEKLQLAEVAEKISRYKNQLAQLD